MYFYEVWVASRRYHKPSPLTYSADLLLKPGTIVELRLKNQPVIGFVAGKLSTKPSFAVKPIERAALQAALPPELIKLHAWLGKYYPAPSGIATQLFTPKAIPKKTDDTPEHASPSKLAPLPALTPDQTNALAQLSKHPASSVLLHGDTGTGKTRVYLELAIAAMKRHQSVLILTPEIGLTPQLAKTFQQQFDDRVIVTHSHLTDSQRRATWFKVASSKEPLIIIGPRSALFLPLQQLGLIVLDEAHDSSYKQEQAPNYQTTRVAAMLAQLHHCQCIFGTATPLVADYYALQARKIPIIRMTHPVHAAIKAPTLITVDRADKEAFKRSWLFSEVMIEAIKQCIAARKTSLIFLNRRGTARLVICNNCGWHAVCPNCDLSLTYHQDDHQLKCHVCSYTTQLPLVCPSCSSTDIGLKSAGTKALQTELEKLFPGVNIVRFDSDVTASESLEKQYEKLHSGGVDIVIGTQMIAKGLDLPNLGLVAIPFADTSLYIPDFTADEQTYQLLTQVMGRVGRTSNETKIIVQAFDLKQAAIQAALAREWGDFYNKQLVERRQYAYPPYYYLLQLSYSKKREQTVKKASLDLAKQLQAKWPETLILGPAPHFHHKVRGDYNWQIIVKAKDRGQLLEIITALPTGWRHNIDPSNLL